jgi:hypothetical protein
MIQIDHKGGYLIQFTIKLDTKVKIFEKSDTKDFFAFLPCHRFEVREVARPGPGSVFLFVSALYVYKKVVFRTLNIHIDKYNL